jgi:hypothetical protein
MSQRVTLCGQLDVIQQGTLTVLYRQTSFGTFGGGDAISCNILAHICCTSGAPNCDKSTGDGSGGKSGPPGSTTVPGGNAVPGGIGGTGIPPVATPSPAATPPPAAAAAPATAAAPACRWPGLPAAPTPMRPWFRHRAVRWRRRARASRWPRPRRRSRASHGDVDTDRRLNWFHATGGRSGLSSLDIGCRC